MPGRKDEVYDRSYITQERTYRYGVSVADVTLAGIPIINLDLDIESAIRNPAANTPVRYQAAYHGHDAVLGVFVVCSATNVTATLQFWRRVDDAAGTVLGDNWCLVQANNITGNTVLRVPNLIAGKYRIAVSAVANGGIDILVAQTV